MCPRKWGKIKDTTGLWALTVLAIVPLQVCAEEFLEVLSEQVFPHSRFNDDRQFTRVEEEHIRSLYRETNKLYTKIFVFNWIPIGKGCRHCHF